MNELETFAASGSTTLPLGPRDEKWDSGKALKSLQEADLAKAFFWRDPDGDPKLKGSYKLPFAERDGDENALHANWGGITASAQRLSQTHIPEGDVAGVQKKIEAYYAKAAKQYDDDTIEVPWKTSRVGDGFEFFSAIVPLAGVEVRDPSANPDNTWTFSGYASVFDQQAVFLDSKWLKVLIEVDPGAFDVLMRTQQFDQPDGVVHYNRGHNMDLAVAATDVPAGQPGSLQLSVDSRGLRYLAKVSKDDPDGLALAVKMRDGVIKQASMAFMVGDQEITETESEEGPDVMLRKILSVSQLFDVCACPQGVFSQTVSDLQQFAGPLFGKFGQPGAAAVALGGHPRHPEGGGAIPVIPSGGQVEHHRTRLSARTEKGRKRFTRHAA